MAYFLNLLELWCLLFICVIVGRRVVDTLPNIIRLTIGYYVAPILGLAVLVLLTTLYGWVSPFKFSYSILSTLVLVTVALAYEKKRNQFIKSYIQLSLFSTLCALPVMAPMLLHGGYNPYTDIFTYLAQGQWLQSHSFAEKAIASGYYPTSTQVLIYQTGGIRMGGSFFLGFVQSLFALQWSYYAYIPTVSIGFVTGCLSIGGIIRQVVPVKKTVVLSLATLPCFLMTGFLFGAQWGFFPQTFGLAFLAGLSALFPYLVTVMFRNNYAWPCIVMYTFPAALCTAAFLFAYNEPFPIIIAAMGLFVLILACVFAKKKKMLLSLLIFYIVEVLILINYEAIRIAHNLIQTLSVGNGAVIGWPVLWCPMQFLAHAFGLKSPNSNHMFSADYFISVWIFPIFFIFLCIVLFRFIYAKPKRKLMLLFLVCFDFIFLVLFVKFRYFIPNSSAAEIGYTFLQYKITKYAAPFSLALVGIFGALVWFYKKKFRPLLICLYLILLVFGLYFQCFIVSKNLTIPFLKEVRQRQSPFEQLLQLRSALSTIPKDEVVHLALGQEYSKLRQMVAYVLYDRQISSDYRDDVYLGSIPMEERNRSPNDANWLVVMNTKDAYLQGKMKEVGPFMVFQKPFNFVVREKTVGGYNTEFNEDGESWNWVANAVDLYFINTGSSRKIKFGFKLRSYPDARLFHIELKDVSGTLLARYNVPMQSGEKLFESPWVETGSDHLVLHVEADGKPVRLSKRDARETKFLIGNVVFHAK